MVPNLRLSHKVTRLSHYFNQNKINPQTARRPAEHAFVLTSPTAIGQPITNLFLLDESSLCQIYARNAQVPKSHLNISIGIAPVSKMKTCTRHFDFII